MFYVILDDALNIFPLRAESDIAHVLSVLEQQRAERTNKPVRQLYIGEDCQVCATKDSIHTALQNAVCLEIHSNNTANNGWLYRIEKLDFINLTDLNSTIKSKVELYAG